MKTPLCGGLMVLAVALAPQIVRAQNFTNLNFESANVSGYSPGYVPISAALPGWAAYYGPSNHPTQLSTSMVGYDGFSTGGAVMGLEDSNAPNYFGPPPIQGDYSVLLQGSIPAAGTSASIGQTGTIPNTAQTLTFYLGNGFGGLQVTFNGQMLSLVDISNTLNYAIWGADISAYAGQSGQLLFTTPVNTSALLDNIQFSSISIPEPGVSGLLGLGGMVFLWHRRKNSPRQNRD
jgi:hypothetical protein